ncbi:exosortase A [Pseudoduganella violacea]|uniref:Exosortase A n=1 Tax=Pseudoduganella violacea TaxID=1715466 RepID=A0A7W5FRZ2_9BURK|nr:exosortase A [Pseudoduganella violacea]MBB3117052.1 exosortase A [Pseudoduganella violacea]
MNTVSSPSETKPAVDRKQLASGPSASSLGLAIAFAALLLPFLIYFDTALSIAAIWERSGTFAHGYVILPISLWLIWQRRATLRTLPVQPYLPALAVLAACGAGWLLAELGEVQIVRQYAFAAMLPLTVLALFGVRIAKAIAFPLFFILFGVPVGESLIDPLIQVTASFTVDALRLTGIPVLREGNNFSIPSGDWSVVEACSGLRYLISSITLGCLFAYLTYRTFLRRALFVLASMLVPIAANGARAYMIVMIGHMSGMTMAVGVDHLIYGWAFFGLVMLLLFWVGSFWRQDQEAAAPTPHMAAPHSARMVPAACMAGVALGLALAIGVWPAYAYYLQHGQGKAPSAALNDFQPGVEAAEPFTDWKPGMNQANAHLGRNYQVAGQPLGFELFYFRQQHEGSKLISSSNRLVGDDKSPWHDMGASVRSENIAGRQLAVRESVLNGPRENRLLVWQWYWIDGQNTASNFGGKLLQVKQKLLKGRDDGAIVLLYSPYEENPDAARAVMRHFLSTGLTPLEKTLAANLKP